MAYAVPQVAGVPPLMGGFASVASFNIPATIGQIIDISNTLPGSLGPQWGIFLNGVPVITADTVVAEDFRQEFVIADFVLEGGGFESYDKVWRPFDVRMTFVTGIDDANRAAMINSVQAIAGDLNLYDFVAPDVIFTSVNIAHQDFHREAQRGVGALPLSVWGWQISVIVPSGLQNAANPGGNDASVVGPSQATGLNTSATTQGGQVFGASSSGVLTGASTGASLGIPQVAGPSFLPSVTSGVQNAPYATGGSYNP